MLQVTQIVNSVFTSNTYLVFDDEYDYCWLVDIGDYDKVADVLPIGMEVRGVFLTHSHFDHIYGANALYRAFPNCITDVKPYIMKRKTFRFITLYHLYMKVRL